MDMRQLMKQAQKMQKNLAQAQEELAGLTVESTSGGGLVKAVVSGAGELKELSLDAAMLEMEEEDAEFLADMVLAAINEAMRSAQELAGQKMGNVTGGMNIPGMPGMPF